VEAYKLFRTLVVCKKGKSQLPIPVDRQLELPVRLAKADACLDLAVRALADVDLVVLFERSTLNRLAGRNIALC